MKINEYPLNTIEEELNAALDCTFILMERKKTDSGSVTLKISIEMLHTSEEFIKPDGTIEERLINVPHFKFDISKTLKLTEKIKDELDPIHKLVYDQNTGEYSLKEICDGQTRMEL